MSPGEHMTATQDSVRLEIAGERPRASVAGGLWRLADPKVSLASAASMLLGAFAAAADGPLHLGWLAATVAAVFAIEVAKNASGEIFDFDSGADLGVEPKDRSPFSGGKRVLVEGLLTRTQTGTIAATAYAIGIVLGLIIAVWREPAVVVLGLVGVTCAYFYHAPPLKLSYRGLGEIVVGLCYGPLIASGTYLVQRGELASAPVVLGVPLGLLVAAFLWINEFPDYEADRRAGKWNLVVQLGRRRASRVFCALAVAPFTLLAAAPLLLDVPPLIWLGLLGLPLALAACRTVLQAPETTAALIPAQRNTLLSFLVYASGTGLGLVAG